MVNGQLVRHRRSSVNEADKYFSTDTVCRMRFRVHFIKAPCSMYQPIAVFTIRISDIDLIVHDLCQKSCVRTSMSYMVYTCYVFQTIR
jgi:hypothetical protein